MKNLKTTVETTVGTLFKPMLDPLSQAANYVNQMVSGFREMSEKKPVIPKIVSGGVAGLGFIGTVFAVTKLLGGLKAGGRFFRGLLRGPASTAIGVAEGLAVHAATGVVPVFVTNWSESGFGGSSVPIGGKGGGTILDRWGNPIATGAGGAAGGAATEAGASVVASGAGMFVGTVLVTAALVSITALGSETFGKWLAEEHAKFYSDKKLEDMRARQMVMGGGQNSFQVQAIDAELARRAEEAHSSPQALEAAMARANAQLVESIHQIKNVINIRVDEDRRAWANSGSAPSEVNMTRGNFFGD